MPSKTNWGLWGDYQQGEQNCEVELYRGDNDELCFRDYLNEHPHVAKEYEKLKLSLQRQYEHNRDAYTEAKSTFVKE